MRKELELIEKIESYLDGSLSADEKTAFENEMSANPVLREEVRLQQEIMTGLKRSAWTSKVQQAGRRFKRWERFKRWGSIGLGLVVLSAAVLYFSRTPTRPADAGEMLSWLSGLSTALPTQTFILEGSRDTVVETRGGIVLSIPANGFLDKNARPVTGKLTLIIKEALDPASIIRAGLSTRSGDQLLETGGMFYIDAIEAGQHLKIDPTHGIYTEVPTDSVKPGMQLFSGQRLPDGTIDWLNPRPLDQDLVPFDILRLNFYPPIYLDSLRQWGYNIRDKQFTDSLYYSIARLFSQNPVLATYPESDSFVRIPSPCGINPAKIKSLWNDHFQNTLLSTREFEERIAWIHRSENPALLDLYANNLDKDLYVIDSMAAAMSSGSAPLKEKFLAFYSRHDGRVKSRSPQFQKLRDYYQAKTKIFTEAIAKTENEFWAQQANMDRIAGEETTSHWNDSAGGAEQNFNEELDLNLKNALHQLGYDTTTPLRPAPKTVYRLEVVSTGWCNIDRAVNAATVARATLNYMDPQTGKKALIQYLPVSFQVENPETYDRLYVYLLPNHLSSFMRLSGSGGKYTEKLDELMEYTLFCIAYKGQQAFFYSRVHIEPKDYAPFSLTPIGEPELDRKLNSISTTTQASDIRGENAYFRFDVGDQGRCRRNQALQELGDKVLKIISPCYAREPVE